MSDEDEEFQASSEDIEIKPWDLPYWSGGPAVKKKPALDEKESEDEVEVVAPITVEELETIRNEGYEEGFLQGLNEGREKGEKEGIATGKSEGHKEGHKQGTQEGNRLGFEAGQAEGLAAGKEEIALAASNLAKLTQQLEQSLVEKDSALPAVLSQLIKTACETIIGRELEQGDNQITQKVLMALEQLPSGAENIKIFVSSADSTFLEEGLKTAGCEMNYKVDASLETGSARITTTQSLLEFSLQERMDAVFERIDQECEKLDLTDIEGEPLKESKNVESSADDASDVEELDTEAKERLDAELDTSIDPETSQEPEATVAAEAPELTVAEEANTEEALVEEAIEENVEEAIEDTATDNQNDLSEEDDVT
jgi:flagellar assembly protein FliH